MDANNQMQLNFAPYQVARLAQPPARVGQANPDVATCSGMIEDQLTRFMTRAMTFQPSTSTKNGSFKDCTIKFSGNAQEVQMFIFGITLYKDVERINDETALRELPFLLEGKAATWWMDVKENIYNWPAAIKIIQETFAAKKPAYEIYQELFATKQDSYIPTEMFIRQKLALLAQLPRPLPEDVQTDMIYSLLKPQIQKKVPRNSVISVDQLINAANCAEHAKDKKRMRKFVNFDFETMKPASKSKEKCSHCRKSKKRERMEVDEVGCYKCNERQSKRRKNSNSETVNPVYAPLQAFNANMSFNPSSTLNQAKRRRQNGN